MVQAFSISVGDRIRLETAPLVGGPVWLPLHVKVIVDDDFIFDFVPKNATSRETLQKLLSLQSVPAEARTKWKPGAFGTIYSQRATGFCSQYARDLHLIENNCWTFALDLVRFVLEKED